MLPYGAYGTFLFNYIFLDSLKKSSTLIKSFSNGLFDNNSDSLRAPLNEKSLIDLTNKSNTSKFKYFAIDGSFIIAMLEKPLVKSNISNVCPTTTVILRGPFGRQAWSLYLRNSPFNDLENMREIKLGSERSGAVIATDLASANANTIKHSSVQSKQLSSDENLDSLAFRSLPKCELSIPTLNEVALRSVKNLNKFQRLKEEQLEFETSASDRALQDATNTLNRANYGEIALNVKYEFLHFLIVLISGGFCGF
jgi:hypothetical protein